MKKKIARMIYYLPHCIACLGFIASWLALSWAAYIHFHSWWGWLIPSGLAFIYIGAIALYAWAVDNK